MTLKEIDDLIKIESDVITQVSKKIDSVQKTCLKLYHAGMKFEREPLNTHIYLLGKYQIILSNRRDKILKLICDRDKILRPKLFE